MNNRLIFVLFLLLPVFGPPCRTQTVVNRGMVVMTWNIRYNNPGDGINAWPERKERVFAFLRDRHPEVMCMQEVLSGQLKDIAGALPQYGWFGVGRDDGREAGEYVPVFYNKERFRFLGGGHFWLSETPAKPGKPAWDAACTRMVTRVCLKDLVSGDTLYIFNTHFDHIGVKARLLSAKLLTHAIDSICPHRPVIITGDFNSTEKDTPYEVITAAGFRDARIHPVNPPAGPEYTFTGFATSGKPGDRIDFIYVKNTKPVQNYIVRDDSSNGFYLSDHLPVLVGF